MNREEKPNAIDDAFERLLNLAIRQKELSVVGNRLKIKILIRTPEAKQQEFTLRADVENKNIPLGSIAYAIETAINEHTHLRAHADIISADSCVHSGKEWAGKGPCPFCE